MANAMESGAMGAEGGDVRHVSEDPLSPMDALKAAEAGGDPWKRFNAKVAFYRKTLDAWPPCYESEFAELMGRPFGRVVEVEGIEPQIEQLTD